jgi:hypothetical protein
MPIRERRFVLRTPEIREHVHAFVGRIPLEPLAEVLVRPFVEKRTLPQNSRLWLLHTAAGNYVGCSPEDMHEDMLCMFFGYTEVRMPSGAIKRQPMKRSRQLDKREFAQFMEKVEAFYISQLGVYLDYQAA